MILKKLGYLKYYFSKQRDKTILYFYFTIEWEDTNILEHIIERQFRMKNRRTVNIVQQLLYKTCEEKRNSIEERTKSGER